MYTVMYTATTPTQVEKRKYEKASKLEKQINDIINFTGLKPWNQLLDTWIPESELHKYHEEAVIAIASKYDFFAVACNGHYDETVDERVPCNMRKMNGYWVPVNGKLLERLSPKKYYNLSHTYCDDHKGECEKTKRKEKTTKNISPFITVAA